MYRVYIEWDPVTQDVVVDIVGVLRLRFHVPPEYNFSDFMSELLGTMLSILLKRGEVRRPSESGQ